MTVKEPQIKKPLYKRILRIFCIVLVALLLLIISIVLLIQTSPVQNVLRGKAVSYLQSKLHTKVRIGKIYIGFPKNILLRDVYIEDQQHDTLLSVGRLSVNISMMGLLNREVEMNNVQLDETTVKIKRLLPDTVFNFQFIINSFSSPRLSTDQKANTSAAKIVVREIDLKNIHVIYDDVITGNDMDVFLAHLSVDVRAMNLEKQIFDIPEINIAGLHGKFYQNNPLMQSVNNSSSTKNPSPQFSFRNISLDSIQLDYKNTPGAFIALLTIGKLSVASNIFDLDKKIIKLDKLELSNTTADIRLGKTIKRIENDSSLKSSVDKDWRIMSKEIFLDRNKIVFDDDNSPKQKAGMDYAHINSKDIVLHVNDFLFSSDSVAGNISKGSLAELSGFRLDALQGNFLFAKDQAYIKNLRLQTPGTLIQRSILLRYLSLESLKKNIGSLVLDVDLQNSKLQVKDILTFVPSLATNAMMKEPDAVWLINARLKSSVADLQIDHLQLSGLHSTRVDLRGYVKGLPNLKSVKANLAIKAISSTRKDLLSMLPEKSFPSDISLPETFDLAGTVKGSMNDLFADIVLHTSEGDIEVKGDFNSLGDTKNTAYNVMVATQDLNLGYILKNPELYGNVTGHLNAVGRGLNTKSANAKINGIIQSALYKKYNYHDVTIRASIANQIVTADISIHDPNIYLSLNGSADLSTQYPAVKINSVIDSIKTKPLHFTTDDISYRGNIIADFPVSDPDHLKGDLLIKNSLLLKNGQEIKSDTIKVSAGQADSGQYLRLYADVINAQLTGNYKLTELGLVFRQLLEPYFAGSFKTKIYKTAPYDFRISATFTDKPVLKTFLPTLERLDPIHFHGHFSSSNGWTADFNSPLIIYGDSRIQNLQAHIKPQTNKLLVETSLQQFTSGNNFGMYHTSLNTSIADDKIDFVLNVQDKVSNDKYHIGGSVQRKDSNEYDFSLKQDKLLLNYEKWEIEKNNEIDYSPQDITANNFNLKKGLEELKIYSIQKAKDSPLEISFNKFLISTITGFAGTDSLFANGELNGNIILKNLPSKPTFTSDLNIQNLSIHKDTVGDIALKVSNTAENRFTTDMHITGRGNDISLNGDYFVKTGTNSNFDFNFDIRKLELASVIGISTGTLKGASGSVKGNFAIKGTKDKPDINGTLAFEKAVLTPAMLNSYFFIDGQQLHVDNDGFRFSNFTVLDSAKNKLVVDGNANTRDFRHYQFDLSVNAKDFQALNSTKRDNKLYYGQLFFNTKLNIRGTELLPVVDGSIRVNGKTKLTVVLPQDEPGIQDRQGIVQFVDMRSPVRDSVLNAGYDSIGRSSLRGFDVSTNINIDSTAELILIIDENNGDHLTAKGTAALTGGIDRSGKATLSGTYQLTHGSYDFSFSLLHKKFEIQNGSTITWTGEPTKGSLNINAIYTANSSPIDLVSNQISQLSATQKNTFQQKLPFSVYLKMRGELLKPDISFDVVLPDDKAYSVSKDVITTVQAQLQMLRQDPGEMNKQVFALLLLNRFVGEDPFASSNAGANAISLVRESVSKILTQQLNQLTSSIIQGVDINFDLQSTDDYTTGQLQNRTDLNVSVSKQLLNDRLRVSVGSNFELEGPQNVNANQQTNNLIGNIALDYKLSKDGRYLLRAYRKNNYDDVVQGYVIETGVGFIITIDYDHFREIFEKKKKKLKADEKNNLREGNHDMQKASGDGIND